MKPSIWAALGRELKLQIDDARKTVKTREFWVYFGLLTALAFTLIGLAYVASGFDEYTRQKALMAIACKAGDAQILSIIVGGMVFVLLSLFTLGEVVLWFENARQARANRRQNHASKWRPALFVIGALGLGVLGFLVLGAWCR
jgi:hypothetical protein